MTEETLTNLRTCLLDQLRTASPMLMREDALARGARLAGYGADDKEVRAQLRYLADLNLAAYEHGQLNAAEIRWRITEGGRAALAANGL